MILLREIQNNDLNEFKKFSHIPGMFNLSLDEAQIKSRISISIESFSNPNLPLSESKYTFVAEDLKSGKLLGTSMICGQHGTPDKPHYSFKVSQESRFSQSMNTGFIHGTLELHKNTKGPSELGALVVDPSARSLKLGRQLSFIRLLYLSKNRTRFKSQLLAELLPPLNPQGHSALWEAIGRRFTNLDYWEADQLCMQDKEFISTLFPTDKIYTSLIQPEARNSIGKVSSSAEPAYKLLTSIGFRYNGEVDPFDGGPHLWANVDDISLLHQTSEYQISIDPRYTGDFKAGLLMSPHAPFRALQVSAGINDKTLILNSDHELSVLGLSSSEKATFMYY